MSNTPTPEEQKLREQISRLIVENRNSLNDPTTNEPYDMEGIVSDVIALLYQHQNALLREIEAALPKKTKDPNGYSNEAKLKEWQNGYNKCRSDVKQILANKIKEDSDAKT